ncbi:MAG TPA: alpha/beta hydrolase family protein [Bacteroidales bacterium]|nr:alpha/beta hydrolase family protein [Bacteroidales bacterium]
MILRGTFFSGKLEIETNITFVAPDNFSGQPYKVVYLLHGICGRSGDWVDYTLLPNYSKEYHAIFVMPEVARSFYSDMKYGLNYFSYITEELPLMCNSIFKISAKKEDIAIIGASMGGYGALKCTLSKPEQYGFCGAFSSPCLMLKESLEYCEGAKRFKELFGEALFKDFQAVFGENIEWDPREDVIELAKETKDKTTKPKLYITCGTEDFFYGDNKRYFATLQSLGYDPVFEDWQGNHDWTFFNEALRRALKHFIEKEK